MIAPSLQQVFNSLEGEPLVPEACEKASADTALRMVFLRDDQGPVQVIHRYDHLLDLDRLNQALGRRLRSLPRKELARLQQRHQLRLLPALPGLTHYTTVVDNAVGETPRVALGDGSGEGYLQLGQAEYQRLLEGVQWLDCATSLSGIRINHTAPEKDESQLQHALERFTGLRIQQRLDDTLDIPPLPETAQRILHLRMNPNAEVGELADIVESDPSLAAQVVSWASSSFYASQAPVRSIYDAIMRVLGFDLVMNLAMGLALGRALKQPTDAPEGFIGYWKQSIWMAQSTASLVALMPRRERPEFGLAYLGGLLHNFGYLVLAHVFPPHFSLICRYTEANQHLDSDYSEQYLIGVTREQIASELMQLWQMPPEVITAIRHQKTPDFRGDNAIYARLLYLARALLIERGVPLGPPMALPEDIYQSLSLNPDKVAEEMDMLAEQSDHVNIMAGMMS
ncbi:MAG: HDOD domain-containing protein [Oleiphilaceae bacterium]|nr:HDOD domain-containing protein [Oleiphilaceae bacterium]